ncbi:MAG: hypothetical protein ABWY27_13190 [Telluria sp.]
MKRLSCLAAVLAAAGGAPAQTPDADPRGAYLSAQHGDGRIYGDNLRGDRSMSWRASELRLGRELDPALLGLDSARRDASVRIDFVYNNEGHPDNHHRDGFALQATFTRALGAGVTAELSAGPYSTYNTTEVNGVEVNEASRGILSSVALRYRLDRWAPGLHLRLAYNHVWMHKAHRSHAVMIGVGRHFASVPPYTEGTLLQGRLWLGASLGSSKTTQTGRRAVASGTLEAKQYGGKWALSAKAVLEGDDEVLVDRRGVAVQGWFVQPVTRTWQVAVGFGPYAARNRRGPYRSGVHGLLTMQAERKLDERTKAFFSLSRVKSYQQANDRDVFHVGVMRAFGG